jgi:signal transduction histidine kinase
MNHVEQFRRGDHAGPLLACFQEALGHQLPNHLVAIQGLARLLEEGEGASLSPEGRKQLGRLADLARGTDRLVRALAEVGRLCREARSGEPAVPEEVAREAAAEVNLLYGGPPIVYDFPGDLPAVGVSRQSLYQVLVQLLRNAVRAVAERPGGQVGVGARPAPDGVEVWVADNGCGLPSSSPGHLFAPFQRADGAGLGLFLVRQVTAAWGGRLRVESEAGRGTRVTLLIPNA